MQNNLDGLKSTCSLTELVLKGKDIELLLLKKQVQEKLSVMANVELKDLPRTVGKQICFVPGTVELGKLEDPDLNLDKKKGLLGNDDGRRLTLPNMLFGPRGYDRDIMEEVQKVVPKRTAVTQTDFKPAEATSTKTVVEKSMQTEYPERYDRDISSMCSSNGGSFAMETRGTETDAVSTLEKAVNTRSRTLVNSVSQIQRTESTEDSPTINDESTGMDAAAARRLRRRRERVKPMEVSVRPTTIFNPVGASEGYGVTLLTYDTSVEGSTYNNYNKINNSNTPTSEHTDALVASIDLVTFDNNSPVDLGAISTEISIDLATDVSTDVQYNIASA